MENINEHISQKNSGLSDRESLLVITTKPVGRKVNMTKRTLQSRGVRVLSIPRILALCFNPERSVGRTFNPKLQKKDVKI